MRWPLVHLAIGLPILTALLFGVIISATEDAAEVGPSSTSKPAKADRFGAI